MSLLIHQTNQKPFALQGPTSSHTPHLHPLMRRMSQRKEFQKRSAQRSKVRLSPFHPIPNMKVLRVLRLSSFLAIQTGMYDTPWAGVQLADMDNPNPIQSHCFRSASGVVVVEGDLHYMHLLISSRVTTRMVPMAQGTVDTLPCSHKDNFWVTVWVSTGMFSLIAFVLLCNTYMHDTLPLFPSNNNIHWMNSWIPACLPACLPTCRTKLKLYLMYSFLLRTIYSFWKHVIPLD